MRTVPSERLIDARLLRLVGFTVLAVGAILAITTWQSIGTLKFPDPDDELRLVQVRDLLGGQGWFDLRQHRIDAPGGGVVMHWSRLVDIPPATVILLLTPLIGPAAAETTALVLVPLVTLAGILFLGAMLAKRLLGPEAIGPALLALAIGVPLLNQIRPLRIDHHGWQIVLALGVANALFARRRLIGAWAAGLAMAAWLAISLEGLPMAAVMLGVCAVRWLRDDETGRVWLAHTSLALLAGSSVLFATTRIGSASPVFCDTLKEAHLLALGAGALGVNVLVRLPSLSLPARLGLLTVTGGAALAIMLAVDPSCASGGFAGLDPIVRRTWYDNVAEGLPIWRQRPVDMLHVLIPGLAAIYSLAVLIARSEPDRARWVDYAILTGGALATAILVTRAGSVALAIACVPLAAVIGTWYDGVRQSERAVVRAACAWALALVLVPSIPVTVMALAVPDAKASDGTAPETNGCDFRAAEPMLRGLAPGEVFAPLDISPWILRTSDLTVAATAHHRASPSIKTVIETFTATPEQARRTIAKRGSRYVVFCAEMPEAEVYRREAPGALAALLSSGKSPEWLEKIPLYGSKGLTLWRVVDVTD